MNLPTELSTIYSAIIHNPIVFSAVLITFVMLLIFSASFRKIIWMPFALIGKYYRVHEFETINEGTLPDAPSIKEKYSYVTRSNHFMQINSLISFASIQISLFGFLATNSLMWPLFVYAVLTIIYYLDSFFVNVLSKDFDIDNHKRIVEKWRGQHTESVDIFLPTAGEPIDVLENTWKGITEVVHNYRGKVTVYCLDDAHRESVKKLAEKFDFVYEARPDKGWFKKAGNLRHGFKVSNGTYIAIFDADFRPRADFLHELLPYFYEYPQIGLVQSPQYFDVHDKQNWLQRGAGAVQELFYRVSQVSRQGHNASICVGSNALYRRAALQATGGTALIEHSEDVHTGFNIRMHGWTLQYVPILLAKGLCPSDMKAFFKQQYRWCLGSMTLLTSKKFWAMDIPFITRISYFSGFLYYIHTAISSFFVPIIPIALIVLYPNQVTVENYLLILPSIIFVQIIYPLWHNATYGIEAWSTRSVYGWAHFFAIVDKLTKNTMQWQATGAKLGKDVRYIKFRIMQVLFNFLPSIVWVYLAAEKVIVHQQYIFLPLLLSGIYYYLIMSKVTFYTVHKPSSLPNFLARLKPAASFITISALLMSLMNFGLNKDNQVAIASMINPSPVKNVAGIATKKAEPVIPERGYYIEIAQGGDTANVMIQRAMNTYSAETGDLLTLKQRDYVQNQIFSTLDDKQLTQGEELIVMRTDMKTYAAQSKSYESR